MKRRTLRETLAWGMMLTLLLAGGLSFSLSYRDRMDEAMTTVRQHLLSDVARLARLSDSNLGANDTLLGVELAQVASRHETAMVLIMDERGLILKANRASWRDQAVIRVAPQLDTERQQRVNHSRLPDWSVAPDGNTMDGLQSYERAVQIDEVRSSRRGLIYVQYDLRALRANVAWQESRARLPELVGLVLIFLALTRLLNRHVTQPLAQLSEAAAALKAGRWDAEVPRGGFAEIDQLAAGLDAMRHELSATLHAVPDLVFEMDQDGRYLRVITIRQDLLALPPEALQGRTVHETLPPAAAHTIQAALNEAALVGGTWGHHIMLEVPAGPRWFELSIARKKAIDAPGWRFIMLSRDVTASHAPAQAPPQAQATKSDTADVQQPSPTAP